MISIIDGKYKKLLNKLIHMRYINKCKNKGIDFKRTNKYLPIIKEIKIIYIYIFIIIHMCMYNYPNIWFILIYQIFMMSFI